MASAWKMLGAVDLSASAEATVEHALAMASVFSANLDLLYVDHPNFSHGAEAVHWPPNACAIRNGRAGVRRLVLPGTAAPAIAAHAQDMDADMVLMTSRRYDVGNRLWQTSVADEVMHLSSRPVCITSLKNMDVAFNFRKHRILCVVGLDGRETALLRRAEEIAKRTDAEIVLLHVVPEPHEGLLHYAVGYGVRPLSTTKAAEELSELSSGFQVPVTTSAIVGHPVGCIARAAHQHSADLVLAARAAGRSQGVYGSYLKRVLSRLSCPIMTVPVDTRVAVPTTDEDRVNQVRRSTVGFSRSQR